MMPEVELVPSIGVAAPVVAADSKAQLPRTDGEAFYYLPIAVKDGLVTQLPVHLH